ncbi:hypothetical protein PAXRUDRAFT_22184 [Paxillus rubicundulus Ve08.2h10]|uniref:Uncharacterized protein n=1 Tax=Paxillus rubicundulus Ve08.2h10 TaxID=930991 RepID=A0A0D0BKS7_9AGAM|nr:hypothetical protein PAXRUDRAFT_22184 [Paxillus rubicundulus Ve08.2h10]
MQHYTTTRPDKPIWAQKSSQEIPTQPSHPLLVRSIRLVSQICPRTQLPMPSPGLLVWILRVSRAPLTLLHLAPPEARIHPSLLISVLSFIRSSPSLN